MPGGDGARTAAVPEIAPILQVQTFGPERSQQVQSLLIVLHGDGTPAHYDFAQAAATAIPDSAAIAMLRPGYSDAAGIASPGERGAETGDNFTTDQIASVAQSVRSLKARFPNANTILVGDGSGAALAANLAGVRPDLVDGLVLVSCPCTLPEWMKLMKWKGPTNSLDPLKTAGGLLPGLRAALVVGANDKVTPVRFSRAYAEALALRGIATDYRIVPGKGHGLLDDPEVIAAATRLAAALPRKS